MADPRPPPAERSSWDPGASLSDLVEMERRGGGNFDEDDPDAAFSRNVSRLGSRYKNAEFSRGHGATAGADEEEEVDVSLYRSKKISDVQRRQRASDRHAKMEAVTSRCPWWIRSSSFRPHLHIASGTHVSLVAVPKREALVEGHCRIVPVKHAPSLARCEDEVWDEVLRFRRSLSDMFAKEKKDVLFVETVTDTAGLWQTKAECVPVEDGIGKDAPIFFKSSLLEQADDWGTHTKILSTGGGQGLRRTVPKQFSYFNIEWDGGGYAQIIENSSSFPRNFGLDTIAGMIGADPVRFGSRSRSQGVSSRGGGSNEDDRQAVENFVNRFKPFDWTVEIN